VGTTCRRQILGGHVSAHVDDCVLSCKSLTVMDEFKAHMLNRLALTREE
jgi:hypothetical protein